MSYANQNQNSGLELLPGEDADLVFTERDRRAAHRDIKNGTLKSAERLIQLATNGESIQAEKLLGMIGCSLVREEVYILE